MLGRLGIHLITAIYSREVWLPASSHHCVLIKSAEFGAGLASTLRGAPCRTDGTDFSPLNWKTNFTSGSFTRVLWKCSNKRAGQYEWSRWQMPPPFPDTSQASAAFSPDLLAAPSALQDLCAQGTQLPARLQFVPSEGTVGSVPQLLSLWALWSCPIHPKRLYLQSHPVRQWVKDNTINFTGPWTLNEVVKAARYHLIRLILSVSETCKTIYSMQSASISIIVPWNPWGTINGFLRLRYRHLYPTC